MVLRRTGVAVLCATALIVSACGSDDAKDSNEGWGLGEKFSEPDVGPVEDVAPDVATEPDVVVIAPTECQTDGCPPGDTCSDDGSCVATPCANDDQCLDGLACAQTPEGRRCQIPTGVADGEGCAQDSDCQGGTCITDWPGGFCTTVDCGSFEDCSRLGNENRCLQVRGPDFCVRLCTSDAECREDYICQPLNGAQGMCTPDPSIPIDDAVLTGNPFAISCVDSVDGVASIPFAVAANSTAYMVTPLTKDGREIAPLNISAPLNSIDFRGTNSFQTVPVEIYRNMNPTVVPPAPLYTTQFETGAHTYNVGTTSDEVCWYMLEESAPGDTLDVNVYLVGVPGLTAATAATHVDLQATLASFDAIYQTAGYHLGKIRFYDASPAATQEFAIVRDEGALPSLLMETKRPGNTMDDVLSVNVFFVRGINLGGTIGISLGLPGPAGLHGTQGSGVIFTSEYMGGQTTDASGNSVDGNLFTSQVLAHEVGHYLGLFHTSESSGRSFDVLEDTPFCQNITPNCPDIDNLMFPFAGSVNSTITPDQAFVLGVNPLTKTAITGGGQ
jgi:hypothetical protein